MSGIGVGLSPSHNARLFELPNQVGSGPCFWVRPSGLVSGDTTNIDSWTDESSNVFTISSTGSNRPTLTTGLMGRRAAQFVLGSNQRLQRTNTQLFSGNSHCIIMIMRIDAFSASNNDCYLTNDASDFSNGFEFFITSATKKYTSGAFGVGNNTWNTVATTGGWHVIWYSCDANTSRDASLDRVTQGFSNTTDQRGFIAASPTPILSVGNRGPNNANPCSATIAEIIAYPFQPTANDKDKLLNYINMFHGL